MHGLLLRGLEEVRECLDSICIMLFPSSLGVSLPFSICFFFFHVVTFEMQSCFIGKDQVLQSPRYSS